VKPLRVKVAITGGGTGGHLYPALAVLQRLCPSSSPFLKDEPLGGPRADLPEELGEPRHSYANVAYVGSSRGLEQRVTAGADYPVFLFPMAAPRSLLGSVLLPAALLRSLALLRRIRPGVTFATGGYVSIPVVLASWLLRIPIVLFLPDVYPGKAVRMLAPFARRIALTADRPGRYLPKEKTVTTGYPLRASFERTDQATARQHFGIDPQRPVLVAFGGSQGARNINAALLAALPGVLEQADVIHIAGQARMPEVEPIRDQLAADLSARYHLFPFLEANDMALALSAADLALCRSGASVLAELPATRTPAVLVPLPARRVHQQENAQYLVDAGAAVLLPDSELHENLAETLTGLLADTERLQRMAEAMSEMARPNAAADIVRLIEEAAA